MAESSQRLSPELKAAHGDIAWKGIAGFRNVLVHGYLGINLARVWAFVVKSAPKLKRRASEMLKELEEERSTGS